MLQKSIILFHFFLYSCQANNEEKINQNSDTSTENISKVDSSNRFTNNIKVTKKVIGKVEKITEYNIGNNVFYPKNDKYNSVYPNFFFYEKGMLYIVNELEKKIISLNLNEKKSKALPKLDNEILICSKKYGDITGLHIKDDIFYIGFQKGIIFLNLNGEKLNEISVENKIRYFTVNSKNEVVIFYEYDGVSLFLNNDSIINISNLSNNGINDFLFFQKNDTIYSNSYDEVVNSFYITNGNIRNTVKNIKNIFQNENQSIFLSAVTENYYVFINLFERSNLYLLNRFKNDNFIVDIGNDLFDSSSIEITNPDHRDGIRLISVNDNNFLAILIKESKVQIYLVSYDI